ncbi:uncharacterized protein LOC114350600 [Ostrinia furnacalis]|uniref:uncharacterized protein LOC114350600 n=1 Tax=Ostrinia furnacalis TaxID=93504 RepID=UPI00103E5640|nr:uncharacterized protein LOC114350600 [Ostrinia furnacalis]
MGQKREKWLKFNHFKATIKEALTKLNELVDESDPDTDLPNIVHAFQTAERIREDHPDDDWFHLTGLIHDLGKTAESIREDHPDDDWFHLTGLIHDLGKPEGCKEKAKEALTKLNELVDESDPDTDLPNIVHAFQTAERIREDHPDDDWFHLTGLIHDLGKDMPSRPPRGSGRITLMMTGFYPH